MASETLEATLTRLTAGRNSWKDPCRACATSAITLSGEQTIDGVAIVSGDRVLVTAQASGAANGIYVCSTGAWRRAADLSLNVYARPGMTVRVISGTANSGLWGLTSPTTGAISLGSTSMTFEAVATAGAAADTALAPDFTATTADPDATASYSSGTLSYGSTIDTALTTLSGSYVYDNGRAATVGSRGKMPMAVFVHGYNGTATNISDTVALRAASMGFYVIRIEMRDRGTSPGEADDSARELYDILDAIDNQVSAHPTLIDGRRVEIGYSGGGANVVAMHSKVVDPKCLARFALFGWGDYGESPAAAHSYWGEGDSPATVVTRIGARSDLGPYRARNALRNIAQATVVGETPLHLLWDDADPIGVLLADVRDALAAGDAPTSRWFAQESTTGSTIRWQHGYFEDHADLIYAEYAAYHYREVAAYAATKKRGKVTVCGWFKHPDFEVWTAPTLTANPKMLSPGAGDGGSGGGQRYLVDVEFDTLTNQYTARTRADSGACAVQIVTAGGSLTKDVGALSSEHFDIANLPNTLVDYLATLGFKSVFDSRLHVKEADTTTAEDGEDVITWDRSSAAGTATLTRVSTFAPVFHSADGDGDPYVQFAAAGNDSMTGGAADDLKESGDYAFVCVFSKTANGGVCGWSNASGANASRANLYVTSTNASHAEVNTAGSDTAATDTVTLGATKHVAICEKIGSTLYLTIDGRTRVSAASVGGTFTTDQQTVGHVKQSGSSVFYHTGNVYLVGRYAGALTTDQRNQIVALAQSDWSTA